MPFDPGLDETDTRSRDLIVLEKARARIARGWCQNTPDSSGGSVCMGGAYQVVTAGSPSNLFHSGAMDKFARLLGFRGGKEVGHRPGDRMVQWNDAPGRTQQEVLQRFDTAIRTLTQA